MSSDHHHELWKPCALPLWAAISTHKPRLLQRKESWQTYIAAATPTANNTACYFLQDRVQGLQNWTANTQKGHCPAVSTAQSSVSSSAGWLRLQHSYRVKEQTLDIYFLGAAAGLVTWTGTSKWRPWRFEKGGGSNTQAQRVPLHRVCATLHKPILQQPELWVYHPAATLHAGVTFRMREHSSIR